MARLITGLVDRADRRRGSLLGELRRIQRSIHSLSRSNSRAIRSEVADVEKRMRAIASRIESPEERLAALTRSREWSVLLREVERSASAFAVDAAGMASDAQERAAMRAVTDSGRYMRAAWGQPPSRVQTVINQIINVPTQDTAIDTIRRVRNELPTPEDLVQGMGLEARQRVELSVADAILADAPVRDVAEAIKDASAITGSRLGTIARTEAVRVYRTILHDTYRANSELLDGWIWHSVLDDSTCAACWQQSGQKHKVDEELDGHVNCRCMPIPFGKSVGDLSGSVDELGSYGDIPDTFTLPPTGAETFAQLDDAAQLRILGPGRHALYKSGTVTLADMVTRRQSETYGSSVAVANIAATKQRASRRRRRS